MNRLMSASVIAEYQIMRYLLVMTVKGLFSKAALTLDKRKEFEYHLRCEALVLELDLSK